MDLGTRLGDHPHRERSAVRLRHRAHAGFGPLHLADVHLDGVPVPLGLDLEHRVARAAQPHVDEPADVLARGLGHGGDEVLRVHRLEGVLLQEMPHSRAELGVAGDVAEQPEQRRALRIGMGVEVVVRPPPLVRDDRPEDRLRLAEVGLPLPAHVLAGPVGAQLERVPEVLRVGPEALGQPGLAPVAVGGQVAPPVVRHLVGDEAVAREVLLGALVVDRALAEHGRGGALGAAADPRNGDLVVLVPRIGNAELLVEERHHRRRLVEAAMGVLHVLRIDPVVHRDVPVEVLDDLVGTGDQHREVGRVGQVEPPVVRPGAGPGSLGDADQRPVREHLPVLPDGGEQLEGGPVRRVVHRGIPVPGALGEGKGVDELGVGIGLVLEVESEVVARRHPVPGRVHVDSGPAVVDLEDERLACRERLGERDGERFIRVGEVEVLTAGAGRVDPVGRGVQRDLGDVLLGLQLDLHLSVHALGGLVQIEGDPVVQHVEGLVAQLPDRPAGAVLVGRLRRGWLAAPAAAGDQEE